MELFRKVDALIDQQASDPAALKVLFNSLLLIVKIFYSLNSQDIPEFFEDNHESLFALLHKYLIYKNPALETDDDEEAGPIEKVKSNICEVIDLYAKRYEDEFTKLPQFVDVVWHLLTNIGKEPKNDEVREDSFFVCLLRHDILTFSSKPTACWKSPCFPYFRRQTRTS